jgi:uncharacterized protein YodC (DUF2158 family)
MSLPVLIDIHPECARMHVQGYCVCAMVECIWCDRKHPPHHPCEPQVMQSAVKAVCTFILWGAA